MRWPRTGIVVGVMGLVLLGAGWWLAGVGAAGPTSPVTRAAAVRWPAIPQALLKQLEKYLFRSAHPPPPSRLPIPRALVPSPRFSPAVHGSTCFVAGGFCSIKPCVVPVATAPASGCPSGAAPSRSLVVSRPYVLAAPATFRPPSP